MESIKTAGIQVIAVSYDSVDVLRRFAADNEIKFPLLSDPGSHVIKSIGLLNESAGEGRYGGIAHPMTVLVDKERKVIGRIPGTVRTRHSAKQLIESWRSINGG